MKESAKLWSLLILGSVAIVACGGTNKSGEEEPKTTIIYRTWDTGTEAQNNEERHLVAAFEKKENVRVKIVENPGSGSAYWDYIKASVVNGVDLADVMMVPNLDWPLASQFLLNIKQYADADEEFAKAKEKLLSK